MMKPNETIPYVTRNLRHLLAAPNLTEAQRTILTRTLATLSEEFSEHKLAAEQSEQVPNYPVLIGDVLAKMAADAAKAIRSAARIEGGR